MTYGRMPLFPPECGGGSRACMPLFCSEDCCGQIRPDCQRVRIQNPARPGDYADVELCVDRDGNLSICVHRPNQNCGCAPRRKCKTRCDWNPWMR